MYDKIIFVNNFSTSDRHAREEESHDDEKILTADI